MTAADLTIRIPAANGTVGGETKVPILFERAADLGAIEIDLAYDSRLLEFVNLEAGRMNGGLVDFKLVRPGLLRIGSIAEPSLNGEGELFVITVKVIGPGTASLEFQRVKANAGSSGAEIPAIPQSGTLTAQTAAPPGLTSAPAASTGGVPNGIWVLVAGLVVVILALSVWIAVLLGRRRERR